MLRLTGIFAYVLTSNSGRNVVARPAPRVLRYCLYPSLGPNRVRLHMVSAGIARLLVWMKQMREIQIFTSDMECVILQTPPCRIG
jgi:hypothetical protein